MRHVVAALLLLTQIFAIFAPGTMVWCAHDGRVAMELVGSECCRRAHEAERIAASNRPSSAEPSVGAPVERCHDVPVQAEQAAVVRSTVKSEPAAAERDAPVAIVVWATPQPVMWTRPEPALARGPPPGAVPRRSRLFVLRC